MKLKAQILSAQPINYKDKSGAAAVMYKHEVFLPDFPAIIPVMGQSAHKPGNYELEICLTRDRQSLTVLLPS
ncbi:MAG: hypothetical protein H7835_19170 [Magnetococcus sp. XQGC-1]